MPSLSTNDLRLRLYATSLLGGLRVLVAVAKVLIRVLPTQLASRVMRAVAERTKRPKVLAPQQEALNQASMLRYGKNGHNAAWSWGTGPLVILVHGWNGHAAQLAPLAAAVAGMGFQCVAIDVTGHGHSSGTRTSWRHFIDDIAELTSSLGKNVHAYIGHSAGGLATMAARAIKGINASRYVCICAPSHPFPPIRAIKLKLAPAQNLLVDYQDFIAAQFETTWSQLSAGQAFIHAEQKLLLFYDDSDRFVDHTEGDFLLALWPGARLVKSSGHGHTRVLSSQELAQEVGTFLRA